MKALRARDRNHRATREIVYPESDGMPMAETDVHRAQMTYLIDALELWFEKQPSVYVAGNNFLYYQQGDPKRRVSPDLYVVKGVPKGKRRVFKTWEEKGRTPCVVVEVSSVGTKQEDLGRKFLLYCDVLKVKEYYIYDPLLEYIPGRLSAWELKGGKYVQRLVLEARIHSRELGLDLVHKDDMLRLLDPKTGSVIPSLREAVKARDAEAKARAEAEKARAEAEKARSAETKAREGAERRASELEEQLARLKRKGGK